MPSSASTAVKINGKSHRLRFTEDAFERLEDEYGITPVEVGTHLVTLSVKRMSAVLWAGLLHADEDLEYADVRSEVKMHEFGAYAEAIMAAYQAAFEPLTNGKKNGASGKAKAATTKKKATP